MAREQILPAFDICEEDAEILYAALAVLQYEGKLDVNELLDSYSGVGKLVSIDLRTARYQNADVCKEVFEYFQKRFDVQNLADFKHMIKKREDPEYLQTVRREGERRLEVLAAERKMARNEESRQLGMVARWMIAERIIETVLPHVSYDTLFSVQLWREIDGEGSRRLSVSYEDYKRLVERQIIRNPSGVGGLLPESDARYGTARRRKNEIEYALKVFECVGTGPSECWHAQKEMYYQDVYRLAKFASFQTLATRECYEYLGERFKSLFQSQARSSRFLLQQGLLEHVKVVGDVMEQMDAIDMIRMKKIAPDDYDNFIIRKQEMLELKHRFGFRFNRYADESQILDEAELRMEQKNLIILYALLKDKRTSGRPPNTRRVISEVISTGRLGSSMTVTDWLEEFDTNFVNAPSIHLRQVREYLRESQ